jgi:hypothetical protein
MKIHESRMSTIADDAKKNTDTWRDELTINSGMRAMDLCEQLRSNQYNCTSRD